MRKTNASSLSNGLYEFAKEMLFIFARVSCPAKFLKKAIIYSTNK